MSERFRIAIPARHGSTRFPGKPLAVISGRPMLEHVWRRAVEAGADQVVVATDDSRIADVARRFGAEVCMTGTNHASGTDRLAEVARSLGWGEEDIIVNLQGDEPLTPPVILAQVAANLGARPDVQMATLAAPLDPSQLDDPNIVKLVTDARGFALYFSRAAIPCWREGVPQDPDPPLRRHLGIYAYRAGFLQTYTRMAPCPLERAEQLEQLRVLWHGHSIHVADAAEIPGTGVDVPDDVAAVEMALRRMETEGDDR